MSDRHVVPAEDGWHVEKNEAQRASAKTPTQAEAIKRAVEIVANDGGGEVIVHGIDGAVRERRSIAADTERTTSAAAATAADATATGAAATTRTGAAHVGDTADAIAGDADVTGDKIAGETRTGARKAAANAEAGADGARREAAAARAGEKSPRAAARDAASIAATAADQVGDQADRTARQVTGEARGAARRSGDRLDALAARGEQTVVHGADRAATIGRGVGDELESASDRTGRRIHATTESAAAPLDALAEQILMRTGRLAHILNPVRVTGRTVGAATAVALHLAGRTSTRATAAASRGARQATRD